MMKHSTVNSRAFLAIFILASIANVTLAIHSNDAFDDTGFNFNFDDDKSFFKRASSYQSNQRADGTGFNVRIDHRNGNNNNNNNNNFNGNSNNEQGATPTAMTVTSSTQSSNYLNNGQRMRHNSRPNSNGGARFYSGSNRLNIQRPIGAIGSMNHQASNGPVQSRGSSNYHSTNGNGNGNGNSNNNINNNNNHPNGNNERGFFGNSDINSENWGDLPPESSNQPAKSSASVSSYANDVHNVDQVQLPSGVPNPATDPRAQFIKQRVGHENSEGKPFGSKLKYTFRDPKAPNNYMEVTEVRMSMNRQYNDGNNNGGGNNNNNNGNANGHSPHGPPPPPAPPSGFAGPPPMPPMGPGGHFASHASAPDGFVHNNFDPFSSSSSGDEFGDFGPNGPDFNFDAPAEPSEPMGPSGPSASPSQNHIKCNHPSHRQESQHKPITGPSLGPNSNAFTDLSSFFHSPAQSSPSLVRSAPTQFEQGPGDHNLESFFTDSFLDDPFMF